MSCLGEVEDGIEIHVCQGNYVDKCLEYLDFTNDRVLYSVVWLVSFGIDVAVSRQEFSCLKLMIMK